MPNLASLHPQVVHFVIALGVVGILFRLASLFRPRSWLSPAAAVLILLTAVASVVAVKSGDDAHGVPERIPGVRDAVIQHEEWGERARNGLIALAGLEILALAFARRSGGRFFQFLAALGGLGAGFLIYRAGDLGGHLVYQYAGGVGTRSGEPADVTNLLVAGLYHAARNAREAGNPETAARLIEELARTRPGDTAVRLLAAESQLRDRRDPTTAITLLETLRIPPGSRYDSRHGLLTAEAMATMGFTDSARAVLQELARRHPDNQAVRDALSRLR